jgi:hypothetical protein
MMHWPILIVLCLASGPALAEIYRWVDSAGQVHYGERPPTQDAERVRLPSSPGTGARDAPSESERRARQQRLLESYEYERARKAERQAAEARRQRELAAQCDRLRRYWQTLAFAGPVYVEDDGGQRRYLDDAERAAEQARLRPAMERACGASSD